MVPTLPLGVLNISEFWFTVRSVRHTIFVAYRSSQMGFITFYTSTADILACLYSAAILLYKHEYLSSGALRT